MHTAFAIAGSVINFVACLSHVRAILKGQAAPNRVTSFLWALVPLIAGAAQPVGWVEHLRNPSALGVLGSVMGIATLRPPYELLGSGLG